MAEEKCVPRLKQKYYDEVRDELQKQFNYGNVMQIPRFEKIVVNMGVGEAATDSKAIDGAIADLRAITGQQPLVTHARKSIATFHLRAGQAIGAKVTLRGDRMWGVPRPPHRSRHPAHPRLPWPLAQELRRPRQLLHGRH